jgi:DNA modification methylase
MKLILGDSLQKLKDLPTGTIDAVVTDPPYGWSFMGKAWDNPGMKKRAEQEHARPPRKDGKSRGQGDPALCAGLYDQSFTANQYFMHWTYDWAQEAFRVLKPGAHMLVFCGPRTYHAMAMGVEMAGFEIRDQLQWLFGSGFPKSLDVSKAIDKQAGAEREVVGINPSSRPNSKKQNMRGFDNREGAPDESAGEQTFTAPATDDARKWQGWGTALKPANEPIVLARKPLEKGLTVAANVLKWGTGAINVDASRIGTEQRTYSLNGAINGGNFGNNANQPANERESATAVGRWPANVLFDEWDEQVLALQDSIPEAAKVAIEEYYAGYGKMSDLRKEVDHLSEPERPQKVLQSGMLCEGLEQETAGRSASDVRQKTLGQIDSQDEANSKGQCSARERQSDLEGRMALAWLSSHTSRDAPAKEKSNCGANDNAGPGLSGASTGDGAQTKTATQGGRGSASQKRREAGQSPEQSRIARHEPSQERTLAGIEGGASSPLLVRQSDVPQVWARYFKDSGFTVRAGAAAALDEQSGDCKAKRGKDSRGTSIYGNSIQTAAATTPNDSGGASRFFYVAKTSKRERNAGLEGMPEYRTRAYEGGDIASAKTPDAMGGKRTAANNHPTVKPIKLMEYLVRMITPPGGIVLDPFLGSGTTLCAAARLGFQGIGIEMSEEYLEIARRRIEFHAKHLGEPQEPDDGQLPLDLGSGA